MEVAAKGLLQPKAIWEEVQPRSGLVFTNNRHGRACRYFAVRPFDPEQEEHPDRTDHRYCVYDELSGSYGYRQAWLEKLVREFAIEGRYETSLVRRANRRDEISEIRANRACACRTSDDPRSSRSCWSEQVASEEAPLVARRVVLENAELLVAKPLVERERLEGVGIDMGVFGSSADCFALSGPDQQGAEAATRWPCATHR